MVYVTWYESGGSSSSHPWVDSLNTVSSPIPADGSTDTKPRPPCALARGWPEVGTTTSAKAVPRVSVAVRRKTYRERGWSAPGWITMLGLSIGVASTNGLERFTKGPSTWLHIVRSEPSVALLRTDPKTDNFADGFALRPAERPWRETTGSCPPRTMRKADSEAERSPFVRVSEIRYVWPAGEP